MAVKIRFKRIGRKKSPFYRIVAIDSSKKRNGKEIERLGWFNPVTSNHDCNIKEDLVIKWLKDGAIPSDSVNSLFKRTGLNYKWHLITQGKSESKIDELLQDWLKNEETRNQRKKDKKLSKISKTKSAEEIEVNNEASPTIISFLICLLMLTHNLFTDIRCPYIDLDVKSIFLDLFILLSI